MSIEYKAWVAETGTLTGTDPTYTLPGTASTPSGNQFFRKVSAAFTATATVVLTITAATGAETSVWTYTPGTSGAAGTISRVTLLESSTGAVINWSGVTANISGDIPSPTLTSAGAASAGSIPALAATGVLDSSMLPAAIQPALPTAFPGLELWLRADTGFTPAQWSDQSGAGNHCVQATAGSQASLATGNAATIFGGKNGVLFNGTSDYYSCPYTGEIGTAIVVYNQTANDVASRSLFGAGTSASGVEAAYRFQAMYVPTPARAGYSRCTTLDTAGTNSWQAPFSPASGVSESLGLVNDGNTITIFKGPMACANPAARPAASAVAPTGMVVGADSIAGTIGNFFLGQIAEIIVFSTALTPQQYQQIAAYLDAKYSLQTNATGPYLSGFFQAPGTQNNSNGNLILLNSTDGINFSYRRSNYVTPPGVGCRDPSLLYWRGQLWMFHTGMPANTGFSQTLCRPDNFNFDWVQYIDCSAVLTGTNTAAWAPAPFIDSDGSLHIFVSCSSDVNADSGFQIYELHPIDPTNLAGAWSTPVLVTGTSLPTDMIDARMFKLNGTYNLFYKNESTKYIELMTSTSLTSGYTVVESGNWAATGNPREAPELIQTGPTTWLLYSDAQGNGYYYQTNTGVAATDTVFPATGWSSPAAVACNGFIPQHGSIIPAPFGFR